MNNVIMQFALFNMQICISECDCICTRYEYVIDIFLIFNFFDALFSTFIIHTQTNVHRYRLSSYCVFAIVAHWIYNFY